MAKHPYDSSLKVCTTTPLSKAYLQAVEGDDSADKENQNVRNLIADKEEVSKNKKGPPGAKKSPWGAAPKQNSQNTSQTDEACNFMPKLSKNSMIIASSLGDPLERLTAKKKTPIKRPKQVENEEPTFTPKINSKSILIDNSKRDRSANRFLVLHEQVGESNFRHNTCKANARREESNTCRPKTPRKNKPVPSTRNSSPRTRRSTSTSSASSRGATCGRRESNRRSKFREN